MWNTWKNISAIVLLAFIIVSNPSLLYMIGKGIYNSSVIIISVVEAGWEKANDFNPSEFQKPVPRENPFKKPSLQRTNTTEKENTSNTTDKDFEVSLEEIKKYLESQKQKEQATSVHDEVKKHKTDKELFMEEQMKKLFEEAKLKKSI
jgi:hypothetical protein